MNGIELMEIALRGGAATLCVTAAFLLFVRGRGQIAALTGGAFALASAIYIMTSLAAVHDALGAFFLPVKFVDVMAPALFWLFVLSLLDDDFELRPVHAVPFLILTALYPVCFLFESPLQTAASYACLALTLSLMGHGLYVAWQARADDLVASRRSLCMTLSFIVPLMSLTIGAVELYEIVFKRPDGIQPFLTLLLFVVTAAFTVSLISIRKGLFAEPLTASPAPVGSLSAAERLEIGRLRALMDEGAYLSPGLTIGSLAAMMDVPEHRLRRLINKQLGYRNFATFINDHRITEARRRLADSALAREQITVLAYDLGFASLAPFNRAFRERTGMSPSEFRDRALAEKA